MDKKFFFKKRDPRFSNRFLTKQLNDYMDNKPGSGLDLQPPQGEFDKIIREMEKRKIKPRLEEELNPQGRKGMKRRMSKRMLLAGLALFITLLATIGVSAQKAYDYRARERQEYGDDVVWNNDEYVITGEDALDKSYQEIKEQLDIKPLMLNYKPFDMKFSRLVIEEGQAAMEFTYHDKKVHFIQDSLPVRASVNRASDRDYYKEIFNEQLQQSIKLEKNELSGGDIEYSCYTSVKGVYCYLSGIVEESEFIKIAEGLGY